MVKLILTVSGSVSSPGCRLCLGTDVAAEAPVDEAQLLRDKSELVKGENINVPLLSNGAVQGYFITRISFMMDKEKVKGVHLPVTEMMTDELFTLLVGNKMVDLANTKAFDLKTFRKSIKDKLNERFRANMCWMCWWSSSTISPRMTFAPMANGRATSRLHRPRLLKA